MSYSYTFSLSSETVRNWFVLPSVRSDCGILEGIYFVLNYCYISIQRRLSLEDSLWTRFWIHKKKEQTDAPKIRNRYRISEKVSTFPLFSFYNHGRYSRLAVVRNLGVLKISENSHKRIVFSPNSGTTPVAWYQTYIDGKCAIASKN